jgi:hypothetical protein
VFRAYTEATSSSEGVTVILSPVVGVLSCKSRILISIPYGKER